MFNWYKEYKIASLMKEAWSRLTSSQLKKRLKEIGWTISERRNETMALAPNGKDKFTYAHHKYNFEFNMGNIRGHMMNISKDLAFVWENPFIVPKNFDPIALKVQVEQVEQEIREMELYFYDLAKCKVPIEVLDNGQWKFPDDINYNSRSISFSDNSLREYSPSEKIRIRLK